MEGLKLSILIPTMESRKEMFDRLCERLEKLSEGLPVQIVSLCDNGQQSIGDKRNTLLNMAIGEYIAFVDDDDDVNDCYFEQIFEGIEKGVDCCSLIGEITFDGEGAKKFVHSLKYKGYSEDEQAYYRPNNHLNAIRASIAKQFKFKEINHGEDTDWAMRLCRSGLLKTEHEVSKTIYYYKFITNK